ncbi:hypothetical protein IWX81_002892 [Salinibacterium sp. CAN_S4]
MGYRIVSTGRSVLVLGDGVFGVKFSGAHGVSPSVVLVRSSRT